MSPGILLFDFRELYKNRSQRRLMLVCEIGIYRKDNLFLHIQKSNNFLFVNLMFFEGICSSQINFELRKQYVFFVDKNNLNKKSIALKH